MTDFDPGAGSPVSPPDTVSAGLSPAPAAAGLPTRLRNMIAAPSIAFTPPISFWTWLAPLLVLSVWALVQTSLCAELFMGASPQGAAAMEQLPMGKLRLAMGLGAFAMTWVAYVVPAAFFWFGLSFLLGGKVSFSAVFGVTACTALVLLPRDLVLTFLRLHAGTIDIYTSPAVFLDPEQKPLIAMAEHLDIFALYRLVLLVFGFCSVSGLKRRQVGWLVGGLWVLGGGLAGLLAKLGQSFGQ